MDGRRGGSRVGRRGIFLSAQGPSSGGREGEEASAYAHCPKKKETIPKELEYELGYVELFFGGAKSSSISLSLRSRANLAIVRKWKSTARAMRVVSTPELIEAGGKGKLRGGVITAFDEPAYYRKSFRLKTPDPGPLPGSGSGVKARMGHPACAFRRDGPSRRRSSSR